MGIARVAAQVLLLEGSQRSFGGTLLQLGKQDVSLGLREFEALAVARGFKLDRRRPVTFSSAYDQTGALYIDDVSFFSMLGFDAVRSCDASSWEGCDYLLDLNAPLAPKFFNSFDAIYDGGTLEHVFDVPRALANIHSLLKVGGRVMHASPVSNYVDHGLYCFSPTLFWDYYAANGYEVNQCLMTARTADLSAEALLFSYQPGSLDNLTDGGFNTERFGKYNIFDQFFVATKQPTSTSGVVPMQSRYSRMWGEGDAYGKMPREFRLLGAV